MRVFAFLLILMSGPLIDEGHLARPFFIVWNVGQGQWVSRIQSEECQHFDMGGEFSPIDQIVKLCSQRKNLLYFSHWDWDHIGFARLANRFPHLCVAQMPLGKSTKKKTRLLEQFDACPSPASVQVLKPVQFKTANQSSHVFYLPELHILIPGDSPRSEEKRWLNNVGPFKGLLLGHHGSRTSTGPALLDRGSLSWAIASARKQRYGHPHIEIVRELRRRKIPLLRTEDWGNLYFEQ